MHRNKAYILIALTNLLTKVVAEAGISKGLFYHYFENNKQLMQESYSHSASNIDWSKSKEGVSPNTALYRHYKNKRDIFDSIVERMIQIDTQRAREYHMPDEGYDTRGI